MVRIQFVLFCDGLFKGMEPMGVHSEMCLNEDQRVPAALQCNLCLLGGSPFL